MIGAVENAVGYVYKITNKQNGKVYIGATTKTVKERWKQHLAHAKYGKAENLLHSEIKRCGVDNFAIERIKTCFDIESLKRSEAHFIEEYKATDLSFGYNKAKYSHIKRPELKTGEVYKVRISDKAVTLFKDRCTIIPLFVSKLVDEYIEEMEMKKQGYVKKYVKEDGV